MARKNAKPDPLRPKRPQSAFFLFMSDFRVSFREKNSSNRSDFRVGKAGGEKWRSMSDADKAPYIAKEKMAKEEYVKAIHAYNKKVLMACNTELVNDEDDDDDEEEEDDEGEDNEGINSVREKRK